VARPALQQACSINPGPSLTIIHPTGKRVTSGRYTVDASAKDVNGVARLNFYVDGRLLGTDVKTPFRAILDSRTLVNGAHIITVEAVDTLGAMTTASRVFQVKNTLVARLSNPAVLGRVTNTVTLHPRLIYGGYGVVKVEYWIDRKLYRETTVDPYVIDWNSRAYANGLHRLTMRVTDTTGKQAAHTFYVRVVN